MTTRAEWQQLAEDRIQDAQTLAAAAAPRWSAVFYLAGYAVECGLKACVLVRVAAHPEVIFQDRKFSANCWTHDLESLVILADLKAVRDADAAADPVLYAHWQRAKDWTEMARYQQKTQPQAQRLLDAVTDPAHGVMQWIRPRW